jgi:hypothetical protein
MRNCDLKILSWEKDIFVCSMWSSVAQTDRFWIIASLPCHLMTIRMSLPQQNELISLGQDKITPLIIKGCISHFRPKKGWNINYHIHLIFPNDPLAARPISMPSKNRISVGSLGSEICTQNKWVHHHSKPKQTVFQPITDWGGCCEVLSSFTAECEVGATPAPVMTWWCTHLFLCADFRA